MARATWHGTTVAESDDVVRVEGRTYFPKDAVDWGLLEPSPEVTYCYWKGRAQYWTVVVDGHENPGAAFEYPKPWPLARRKVTDRVAFWRGVEVSD